MPVQVVLARRDALSTGVREFLWTLRETCLPDRRKRGRSAFFEEASGSLTVFVAWIVQRNITDGTKAGAP